MPTENINIETQVQSAITRAALQALIAGSTVKKKIYHITDALAGTATIVVFSRSTNQISYNAFNLNTGKFGMYWIAFDVFNPIIEGDSAVMSYVNNTFFPPTGNYNAVYLDLSTGIAYAWNGTTYFALSGGVVYAANEGAFPVTGATDTIYVATDTGVMYLWNGSAYVALSSNNFIPLSGTNPSEPVTGSVESNIPTTNLVNKLIHQNGASFGYTDQSGSAIINEGGIGNYSYWAAEAGFLRAVIFDGTYTLQFYLDAINSNIQSDSPSYEGIKYLVDYSANFTLESLVSQRVMKSRIWTKAGTPTTTDDSTQGYIVGSLIWDTTNSILYRCTNNTASAAVWSNVWTGLPISTATQTALNLKANISQLPLIYKNTTDSSAITGTMGAAYIRSVLIPANTFQVGDIIRIRQRGRKTGTAGTTTMGIYIHTLDQFSGSTILGAYTTTAASHLFVQMKRDFVIKSATSTESLTSNGTAPTDEISFATAATSNNIDWTVNQYIIFTVNPGNSGDVYRQSYYIIEKL